MIPHIQGHCWLIEIQVIHFHIFNAFKNGILHTAAGNESADQGNCKE
jgi:hypothetical protein